MDHLLHFRINEAVGDHFLIAFVVEQRFHALERQVSFTVSTHNQACLYRLIRDVVVAVNTRDFFNQIFFNLLADYFSQTGISIHHVDCQHILRHPIFNALLCKPQAFAGI